jgi:hypothetical protein
MAALDIGAGRGRLTQPIALAVANGSMSLRNVPYAVFVTGPNASAEASLPGSLHMLLLNTEVT